MQIIEFTLRAGYIPLDGLLKATGLASSGGAAKAMVADGKVQVDGREEHRKTCKIRAGQVVSVAKSRIKVMAEASPVHVNKAVDQVLPSSIDQSW